MKGLPWIRLNTDLREHPKADRLADALGERRAWTYVVELWMWAGANQPDGDLSEMPDSGVARRAGYEGDPVRFVMALRSSGFMDEAGHLHDWTEHQGAIVAKFERDRAKPDGRKGDAPRASPPTPAALPPPSRENPVRDTRGDVDVDVDENVEKKEQVPVAVAPVAVVDVPEKPRQEPILTHPVAAHEPMEGTITQVLLRWRERAGMPRAAIEGDAGRQRRKRILSRLREGWTLPRLLLVADGMVRDPWLMGTDPKSKPGGYRDVETVFRDNNQCERLEALALGTTPTNGPAAPALDRYGKPEPVHVHPPEWKGIPDLTPEQREANKSRTRPSFLKDGPDDMLADGGAP